MFSLPLHAAPSGALALKILTALYGVAGDSVPSGDVKYVLAPSGAPVVIEEAEWRLLDDGGADGLTVQEETALRAAAMEDGGLIAALLQNAPRSEIKAIIDRDGPHACDPGGRTALHYAVLLDDAWSIKMLCKKGADVDGRDNRGNTPLLLSAMKAHAAAMGALLKVGANVEAYGRRGLGAIHWSSRHYGTECLSLLLGTKGVTSFNVNAQVTPSAPRRSPLWSPCSFGANTNIFYCSRTEWPTSPRCTGRYPAKHPNSLNFSSRKVPIRWYSICSAGGTISTPYTS